MVSFAKWRKAVEATLFLFGPLTAAIRYYGHDNKALRRFVDDAEIPNDDFADLARTSVIPIRSRSAKRVKESIEIMSGGVKSGPAAVARSHGASICGARPRGEARRGEVR